jgi:hypothetical protein
VGSPNIFDQAAAAYRLTINSSGNVGVGTESPQARLDVRGDIRLGPTGQLDATSGEERLRIVRGAADADGNIIFGSGFTVQRIGESVFNIFL